jgi:hypothetical protein
MKLGPAAGFALAVTMMGCRHPSTEGIGAADVVAAAIADGPPGLLPARCRRTDAGFALDDGQGLADLEVGDGIVYPGGYAVGIAHRTGAGRVAAIALLHREPTGLTRILDLGPTMGDAPPPRIGWRGGELPGGQDVGRQDAEGQLVAAAYVPAIPPAPGTRAARGDATRDVAIYTVAGGVTAGPPLSISQRRDDSLALDLALAGPAGVLVWDEATTAARGVVKAAAFTRDRAASGRDVSPPDSDAELPRVVPQGGGFAVIWIARRLEPASGFDGSVAEAVGEARAFGWLEMVHVDGQGAAIGPVRRLTSPAGHVSAYDVEARDPPAGSATPSLLVVARDDGEAVDGSGGTLVRVRVTGEVVEPPVAFATDGLGRGAPSFVSAAGAEATSAPALALAWVASGEQTRLIPLDAVGAPTAAPSAEDDLSEARALLFMGRPSSAPPTFPAVEVLVATPSDSAAQLRVFACSR